MKEITIKVPDEVAKELLNKYYKKDNMPWRAEEGNYWFVNQLRKVHKVAETRDSMDDYAYATGNYFKTEEEAEAYLAKQEALGRVRLRALELGGGQVDWSDIDQVKYSFVYDYEDKEFTWHDNATYQYCPYRWLYFADKESCQKLIDEHSEDLKLIFDIKE